jgi:hypothetical protein
VQISTHRQLSFWLSRYSVLCIFICALCRCRLVVRCSRFTGYRTDHRSIASTLPIIGIVPLKTKGQVEWWKYELIFRGHNYLHLNDKIAATILGRFYPGSQETALLFSFSGLLGLFQLSSQLRPEREGQQRGRTECFMTKLMHIKRVKDYCLLVRTET